VRNRDGYEIRVLDRSHVEYKDSALRTRVEVDFGVPTSVHEQSLEAFADDRVPPSTERQELILRRIVRGLEAMGTPAGLRKGPTNLPSDLDDDTQTFDDTSTA
jgi:hypothetical protein